jgi:hypothetical protein
MTKSRRKCTAEQKAAIVLRHLKGKEFLSSTAEVRSITTASCRSAGHRKSSNLEVGI